MSDVRVGAVYRDPRGKPTHGGKEHEHCFTVRAGDRVNVMRYETEDEARAERDRLLNPKKEDE